MKLKQTALFIVIEAILMFFYSYFQPKCEPCIENSPCPLCISFEQKIIAILAVCYLLIFLIRTFKK
jgi:hypothetical protein